MKFLFGIRLGFLSGAIFVCLLSLTIFSQAEARGQVEIWEETGAQEEEKGFNLGQVVITATKTEHTLGDVPVAVSVVTSEEIEAKNIKTVQDALTYLTGVKINKSSSGWGDKGKIQIQGLDAKHTLILVDGQRVLGGHGDGVDLQQISIEMVERIEVVKGPASALYGSDAIGGVVNIITKSAPEELTASASISFGSRKTQVHELSGGFKEGNLGGFLDFTYRTSDGVHPEYIDRYGVKQSDWYEEYIGQGTFQYEITPESKLTLKPYYSKHTTKSGVSAAEMQDRIQERLSLNSIWEWTPDELSKLSLRGSWFDYKHYTADKNSDWKDDSYEAEINYSRLIMDRHTLIGGYHYNGEEIDDKGKDYSAEQTLHSFFIQDEMDFEPITFVIGVRVDNHDKWGTETNPKASVLYNVTEDFKLRGSVGTAFRGPSLVKLYADNWSMGPFIVHSNPDLKPEKSIGYQAGAEYRFSEKLLAEVSFFRNDIEDLINYRTVEYYWPWGAPKFPWDMYWENVDEAMTQGIELNLASQIIDNLGARLGYTFLETEDKTTKRELLNRPKHKVTLEVDWDIPELDLNVNVAGEYIGERYNGDDYEKLNGYAICNLALTKDIGEYVQVFARVDNLFGEKNVEDEYDIDGTEFLGGVKVAF
ncbi:MAG: TonB-dependent receptor [Candidatus Omnitrophota bacterium]|nr:TonB-dependent receptor [Candidatus Omnitrophota bacterium]